MTQRSRIRYALLRKHLVDAIGAVEPSSQEVKEMLELLTAYVHEAPDSELESFAQKTGYVESAGVSLSAKGIEYLSRLTLAHVFAELANIEHSAMFIRRAAEQGDR